EEFMDLMEAESERQLPGGYSELLGAEGSLLEEEVLLEEAEAPETTPVGARKPPGVETEQAKVPVKKPSAVPPQPPAPASQPSVPVSGTPIAVAGKIVGEPLHVPNPYPPMGVGIRIDDFTQYRCHITHTNGLGTDLWIYVPYGTSKTKQNCLLIPSAGTDLASGTRLSDDDIAEHLPYLHENFIVVAFSISGRGAGSPLIESKAKKRFMTARGGVQNGRKALDYILHYFPRLNPSRIFCAGHSSAGTLSLQLAAADPRIKGCVAYAPITNFETLPPAHRQQIESFTYVEGFLPYFYASAPNQISQSLRIPVFIYHSRLDERVPISQSIDFVAMLDETNTQVTFKRGASPGHYESMFEEGIPEAIMWLLSLTKQTGPKL
ncbi:MAG: dienelactone hydrolase, partial [Verrucomicrobiales bacterium]